MCGKVCESPSGKQRKVCSCLLAENELPLKKARVQAFNCSNYIVQSKVKPILETNGRMHQGRRSIVLVRNYLTKGNHFK